MKAIIGLVAFLAWLSGTEPNHQSALSHVNGASQIAVAHGIRPYET
jgi:hypothetical protein